MLVVVGDNLGKNEENLGFYRKSITEINWSVNLADEVGGVDGDVLTAV